jgi:hypothetical protein
MAPAVAAAAQLRRRRACALRSRGERYHGERPQHRRIALAPRPGREAHTSMGKVAVGASPPTPSHLTTFLVPDADCTP